MYHLMCKKLSAVFLALLLVACKTTELVQIPVPPELLRDCRIPQAETQTNGQLAQSLLRYHDALVLCNQDKEALRELFKDTP